MLFHLKIGGGGGKELDSCIERVQIKSQFILVANKVNDKNICLVLK